MERWVLHPKIIFLPLLAITCSCDREVIEGSRVNKTVAANVVGEERDPAATTEPVQGEGEQQGQSENLEVGDPGAESSGQTIDLGADQESGSDSVEDGAEATEPLEVADMAVADAGGETALVPGLFTEPQAVDANFDAHTRTLFRWPENIDDLKIGQSFKTQIRLALTLRNHCIIDDLRSTSAGVPERNWVRFALCNPDFRIDGFKAAPSEFSVLKFDQDHFKIISEEGKCAQKKTGATSYYLTYEVCDDSSIDQLLAFVTDVNDLDYGKIKVNSDNAFCLFAETETSSGNDTSADPDTQRLLISNIQLSRCSPE